MNPIKINTTGKTMSTIENRMIDVEKIAKQRILDAEKWLIDAEKRRKNNEKWLIDFAKQTETIRLEEIARKSATLEFISNHGLSEEYNSYLTEKAAL